MPLASDDPLAALCRLADRVGAPAERRAAQAEMVLRGLAGVPRARGDFAGAGAEVIDRLAAAIARVAAGGAPDDAALDEVARWAVAFGYRTDWATSRALDAIVDAAGRVLRPDAWDLAPGEADLVSTAEDVWLAAGLWDWDELVAEAAGEGLCLAEMAAQEARQDAARDAIARELEAVVRRGVPGAR